MIRIEQLKEVIEDNVRDFEALGRELHTDDVRSTSLEEVQSILADKTAVLMVAKDDEKIIGMATLYIQQKIGSKNGIVEDVVVSSEYRGQGLGEKLMREIISIARKEQLKSISLTSRPHRVAAHKLYQKVGFGTKETTVFKLSL